MHTYINTPVHSYTYSLIYQLLYSNYHISTHIPIFRYTYYILISNKFVHSYTHTLINIYTFIPMYFTLIYSYTYILRVYSVYLEHALFILHFEELKYTISCFIKNIYITSTLVNFFRFFSEHYNEHT